jgi:hypothetical protein
MEKEWTSFRPRNAFEWSFAVLLPLKSAGAVWLAIAVGSLYWLMAWLVTAAGSALIVSAGVWLIDLVASSQPRRAAIAVRIVAGIFLAVGWLFSVLISIIVAFHPIYLIFMVIFTGLAVGVGLGFALAVGAIVGAGRPTPNSVR